MAVLTIKHYVELANLFINSVVSSNNAYYTFVGRPQQWVNYSGVNDDSVSSVYFNSAVDTVSSDELTPYNDMLYGKIITGNDVKNLIPRYNWSNGTVYSRYDQNDVNLFIAGTLSNQFYVVNDSYQVFKVINNNNGSPSTVKPTLTATSGTFSTGDGYVWKYMYTIDSVSNIKFTTSNFIPVVSNTYVSSNAVPGTIDSVIITNGGSGYNVYEDGYLQNFVNGTALQLPATSNTSSGYYVGSSIYLKSGLGAGQIRQIVNYDGPSRVVSVSPSNPFNYYVNLQFNNAPSGTVGVGYSVSQPIDYLVYNYLSGYFNVGDSIIQSDTGAVGTIVSTNSTVYGIHRNTNTAFSTSQNGIYYPIVDTTLNQTGILETGTVSILNNSVYANVVGGSFVANSIYSVNQYIRVGNSSSTNTNIRRITTVNTSVITVDSPFYVSNTSINHYLMPNVFEPSSISTTSVSGTVSNVNLSSVTFGLSNLALSGVSFIVGESVTMVNSANVYQGANGTVAYSNTSALVLSNINGNWTSGLSVLGQSSLQLATIGNVTNSPNITIQNPYAQGVSTFKSGQLVYFYPPGSSSSSGNGIPSSVSTIPNSTTEYLISPTVTISGDGANALAYSVVNTSIGTGNAVSQIVFINPGSNYTSANITITSNNNFGSGASASPLISPINGHGYDAITELGGRYVGISTTFDTLVNESYAYPYYGQFRVAGIIKNPLFTDVTVNLGSFGRTKLGISSPVNSYIPGEVVINTSSPTSNLYSNATGIVVYSNSSYLELKDVKGTWVNTSNTLNQPYGVSSGASATIVSANVIYFNTYGDSVLESSTGDTGIIASVINTTQLNLSNVSGKFISGTSLLDPTVNAYANVVSIYTSNGTVNATTNFGLKFSELMRFTLSSNNGVFQLFESVTQATTNASARVVSTNTDIDIVVTGATGNFNIGDILSYSSIANSAVVIYANNSSGYLKLTNVLNSTNFSSGSTINNGTSSAIISNVYPVVVMNDVAGTSKFQANSTITGNTSGATGLCSNSMNITYPNLVRESGKIIYLENFAPATKSANSSEQINLVIKF